MGFRFLISGDIHLGRRPRGVPSDQDAKRFAPRYAWRALIRTAIAREVDAIALTGDVVDQENRFYEAFSELQKGVQKLVKEGIRVIAVAGNHDFDVLPRLAGGIKGVDLLGEGGKWEALDISSRDGTRVRFEGWSFPRRHVTESPLASYSPGTGDAPAVGLLHCDCQTKKSSYGPVSLADLKARPLDIWALGHIHVPGFLGDGSPVVFYPGSPQGLDPSEAGCHGAWLFTVEPGSKPVWELLPLASLRWERIEISLDGVADEAGFQKAVTESFECTHRALREKPGELVTVGCRLDLKGRTPLHRQAPSLAERLRQDYRPTFEDILFFVESVQDETRPDVVLEDLARSKDPAGLLAERLLVLERGEDSRRYRDLIAGAREAMSSRVSPAVFGSLPGSGEPLSDRYVRGVLLKAGFKALDELLTQKESRE